MQCEVLASVGKNADNRLRVLSMKARITLGVATSALEHTDRVLDQFESFCTVTQSVRQSIPVEVSVYDDSGARLR